MKITKFEEIISWQKSKEMVLRIYDIFSENRDYAFKDQIQRTAVSVMNNIAEGFERKTNKDFKHFLFIAKGSCAELRSMLYLALELKYINKDEFENLYKLTLDVSRLLSGFIKTL